MLVKDWEVYEFKEEQSSEWFTRIEFRATVLSKLFVLLRSFSSAHYYILNISPVYFIWLLFWLSFLKLRSASIIYEPLHYLLNMLIMFAN